jgi:hypothetical protein
MGIWFNGFQTTGTFCNKEIIANTILASYKHVAQNEECPGRTHDVQGRTNKKNKKKKKKPKRERTTRRASIDWVK